MNVPRRLLDAYYSSGFILASASIGSLLVYFAGWLSMPKAVLFLLVPASVLLFLLALLASYRGHCGFLNDLRLGLWCGGFATLAYDLARLPLAHAGIPVFKAISYFGTVILGLPRPSALSEIVGWAYHLSNGVGFAVMYTLLLGRPTLPGAVLWGVGLEAVMLVTPYAEVFGYRRSASFLAITIGAHVFYGIGLWASSKYLLRESLPIWSARRAALWVLCPAALAATAIDFHRLHAASIPVSPPSDIGRGLYVTWNVPEPDRIGSIWFEKRFVDPAARFHFIEPMSLARFGTPFDVPEADVRRSARTSSMEALVERYGRQSDPALRPIVKMCRLLEMNPWTLSSDPESTRLAADLDRRLGGCNDLSVCLERGLSWFDEAYEAGAGLPRKP